VGRADVDNLDALSGLPLGRSGRPLKWIVLNVSDPVQASCVTAHDPIGPGDGDSGDAIDRGVCAGGQGGSVEELDHA
jgi:hypothetical protein